MLSTFTLTFLFVYSQGLSKDQLFAAVKKVFNEYPVEKCKKVWASQVEIYWLILETLGDNNFSVTHKSTLPGGKRPDIIPEALLEKAEAYVAQAKMDIAHLREMNNYKERCSIREYNDLVYNGLFKDTEFYRTYIAKHESGIDCDSPDQEDMDEDEELEIGNSVRGPAWDAAAEAEKAEVKRAANAQAAYGLRDRAPRGGGGGAAAAAGPQGPTGGKGHQGSRSCAAGLGMGVSHAGRYKGGRKQKSGAAMRKQHLEAKRRRKLAAAYSNYIKDNLRKQQKTRRRLHKLNLEKEVAHSEVRIAEGLDYDSEELDECFDELESIEHQALKALQLLRQLKRKHKRKSAKRKSLSKKG